MTAAAPEEERLLPPATQVLRPACTLFTALAIPLLTAAFVWISLEPVIAPLRRRSLRAATSEVEAPQAAPRGVVHAIYSYGSPGVARPALWNFVREDGCFEGLRSFNQDAKEAELVVDAAAVSNSFLHARMDAVALAPPGSNSTYYPCRSQASARPYFGSPDVAADWGLHWEDDYTPRLRGIFVEDRNVSTVSPFRAAYDFLIFAYKSYDTMRNTRRAVRSRMPDWELLERETKVSGWGPFHDEDPVMILQRSVGMECAVVFAGSTQSPSDFVNSFDVFSDDFCGFGNVHQGYRNELIGVARTVWPEIRQKLAQCSKVYCVGHSLGGTMCELLAACVNSQRLGHPDYEILSWQRSPPRRMNVRKSADIVHAVGGVLHY